MDKMEGDVLWAVCRVANATPMRLTSVFYCYNEPSQQPLVDLVASGLQRPARCRLQPICGSELECKHFMLTRGIPVEELPYDTVGTTTILNNKKFFYRWLATRKKIEKKKSQSYANCIRLLGFYDVVIGKGAPYQNHIGNKLFVQLIDSMKQKYQNEDSASNKLTMIHGIIQDIVQHNKVRFLKKVQDGLWEHASHDEIVNKVRNRIERVG
mmetsp:Transcript_4577/g.13201  ORF Transcript_4577/g.13201 Transcript_4577/m.13201 type:complete len:211 (-) Transcript_4577:28-660(-)